jgi:hypothetical protein
LHIDLSVCSRESCDHWRMPKPVKKATKKAVKKVAGTLPVPPKRKRPSDPMKAAQSILAEHMGRVEAPEPLSFEEQYRKRMSELGAKGGKTSGAKRMQMPEATRKAIAKKAAAARWGKKGN